jgi:hypothetical protein
MAKHLAEVEEVLLGGTTLGEFGVLPAGDEIGQGQGGGDEVVDRAAPCLCGNLSARVV